MAAFLAVQVACSLLLASSVVKAQGIESLAPADDILSPPLEAASQPLHWGGNTSPYFAGPNIFGISNEVPERCSVQQAAYVVRHGSRFPDPGDWDYWLTMQEKIQIAVNDPGFRASGALAFIPEWVPVLTNPTLQLSQESMTGFKEAHDLGYQLRARYPSFYQDGNPYYVWANQYAYPINSSRVVQTARAFLQGYLYEYDDTFGKVVSINSTFSTEAIGNSLGPSDACPAFATASRGTGNATNWTNVWVPKTLARVNSMVKGNLTFDETDLLYMPYLCGYESQILGRLSPWCGVFTDEEWKYYEYYQDLGYFYGYGPGSVGPAKDVFLPFLDSLMTLLMQGPGQQGKGVNGTAYTVPDLIMAFTNDDQIAEMTAAMGIFDAEGLLPDDHIPAGYIYNVAHWISMRGTVAFEVLNCETENSFEPNNHSNSTYIRILFNDAVYPVVSCQSGPGRSCPLADYAALIKSKYDAAGNFNEFCNVTAPGHPTTVAGASFFTDLTLDTLTFVSP